MKETLKKMSRNYKKEYKDYHGKPEEVKKRAMRNKARLVIIGLEPGDSREIDHKKSLKNGGSNNPYNLRIVSKKTNRKKGAK